MRGFDASFCDVKHRRYLVTLAYDGTDFEGWQGRPQARSVRSVLLSACEELWGQAPQIESSSRTDAGVHARGLVAQLDFPETWTELPGEKIVRALNDRLPPDLRLMKCRPAPKDLHARFDALSKEYRYQLHTAPVMPPELARYAWHVPSALDIQAMEIAAAQLIGHHDFRAFTVKRKGTLGETRRRLLACRVQKKGHTVIIHLHGDGFLYKMCRRIVGSLVQIGQGKFPPNILTAMLREPGIDAPHLVAPAQGLTLWRVHYPS